MPNLKEIYSKLTYLDQNQINILLTKIEPKIEKYLRNESLSKEEEVFLKIELENINQIILEKGGETIIFTDINNLIKAAQEFDACVNWFKYSNQINMEEEERD